MSCWMKNNSVYEEKRADQKNKTNVPLQVRSPFYEKNMFSAQKQKKARSGSRAFPFISFPECWYRTRHGRHRGKAGIWKPLRASLTLEAALVLPLLIFASVCLMLPAKIMMTERKLCGAGKSGWNSRSRGDRESLQPECGRCCRAALCPEQSAGVL